MSPGPIETPMFEGIAGNTPEGIEQTRKQFSAFVPMGRLGRPEEVANAVLFLASPESSYITGLDLTADGGMTHL